MKIKKVEVYYVIVGRILLFTKTITLNLLQQHYT